MRDNMPDTAGTEQDAEYLDSGETLEQSLDEMFADTAFCVADAAADIAAAAAEDMDLTDSQRDELSAIAFEVLDNYMRGNGGSDGSL
jgi:hypothetical protein